MNIYSDNYNRALLAEIYDQTITYNQDVERLRSLIKSYSNKELSILECFSGTGRMLMPLLGDGHNVNGIELAEAMAQRAIARAEALGLSERLNIKVQDVLKAPWGENFDVVVIGANALFELTSKEMQKNCIKRAYEALKPGGMFYVDNDNWTTPLEECVGSSWVSMEGTGADGTYARQTAETVDADLEKGLLYIRRTWLTRTARGEESSEEYMTSKRPVSGTEVQSWLKEHGFSIVTALGHYDDSPLSHNSDRAIFWAQK